MQIGPQLGEELVRDFGCARAKKVLPGTHTNELSRPEGVEPVMCCSGIASDSEGWWFRSTVRRH